VCAAAGTLPAAYAQTGLNQSYTGPRFSSGTISSPTYTTFDNLTRTTLLTTRTSQTSAQGTRTLLSAEYFGYNVAAATGAQDGRRIDNAAPYPDGYEFGGSLIQTGTGAAGTVNVTFLGSTNTGGQPQAFSSNTWIKGATESGGMWTVRANQPSFLGGYTNATQTGSVTLDLGGFYTAFGTLIGTNPGANLDVTIAGFNTNSNPLVPVFSYTVNDIVRNTANPTFTGYVSSTGFNRVVITGLNTSTGAQTSPYTAYPNAAFIALDQFEVGNNNIVPEPTAAALLIPGGLLLLPALRRPRRRQPGSSVR
jgi:hypothetical protein